MKQMVKDEVEQRYGKPVPEAVPIVDTKTEDALPKEEAPKSVEDDEQQAPPSPINDNKLTQNALDKTDHEKDDDLPTEKISEVEVKPVGDNDGDEKIEEEHATNDRKDDPPPSEE